MKKTKIWAIIGICAVAVIFYKLACPTRQYSNSYVLDKTHRTSDNDLRLYFKSIDLNSPDAGRYFSGAIANPQTVRFFKTLQRRYAQMSLEDHLKAVRAYLLSIMSSQKAEETFALYTRFTSYESSLLKESKGWKSPRTPEDALGYLHRIQEFRRNFFGKDTADELFGIEVKLQEYKIRKGSIAADKTLYGAEKEKKATELQTDMWGDDGSDIENRVKPYNRYTEKLQMYQRDLSEMDDAGRREKVQEFRKEFFPQDVVQRLDKIDEEMEAESITEDRFRKAESAINSDPDLTREEKEKKIHSLQNDVFGDQADAFRRRENITRESGRVH